MRAVIAFCWHTCVCICVCVREKTGDRRERESRRRGMHVSGGTLIRSDSSITGRILATSPEHVASGNGG